MLSKTDRLVQQQIARYFSRLSVVTKIGLLRRTPSVNMNEDEEADANDLASEVETDRTRQKIRRDLAKFRRRLQERVQLLLSQIVATIEPLRFFAYMRLSKREICHSYKKKSRKFFTFFTFLDQSSCMKSKKYRFILSSDRLEQELRDRFSWEKLVTVADFKRHPRQKYGSAQRFS